MTVATPNRTESRAAPRSGWLIGSLILHGCLLLLLLRQVGAVNEAESATPSVTSAKRLEELSEKVRELQTRQLEEKVESLEETLGSIEQLESEKTEQLRDAYPELTESADEDATNERANALEAQQRALDHLEAAMEAFETGQVESVVDSRTKAIDEQLTAEQALAQAATAQKLADRPTGSIERAIELQTTASQILANARMQEQAAQNAQARIRQLEDRTANSAHVIEQRIAQAKNMEQQLDKFKSELESAKEQLKTAEAAKANSKDEIREAEENNRRSIDAIKQARAKVSEDQKSLGKAQATRDQAKIDAALKTLKAARDAVNDTLGTRNQTQHQLQVKQHEARDAQHDITNHSKRIGQIQTQITHTKKQLDQAKANVAQSQNKVPKKQEIDELRNTVSKAELSAKSQLADAKQAQQRALAANQDLNLAEAAATQHGESAPETTQDVFERAQQLERQVAERFKDIRAAEMSLVHQVDPGKARQLIDVALPKRDPLDESALDQNAKTQAQMQHNLDTLTAANQQAEAMDEFAKSLLAQAQGLQREGLEITLAQRQSQAAEEQSQSAEDQGGAIADMTAIMERRNDQRKDAEGSGVSSTSKNYTIVNKRDLKAPPPPKDLARAKPARRFGGPSGTAATGWTFVDSWYILGPFDNAKRANIHKKFPPESLIDLDAKYRTQASPTPVGWRFYQGTEPKIQPRHIQGEYVIYYAWTQLHFESATEVWIAVGSDDRSDLWINDVRVWSSSDILKEWRVDEGMRRVRFEAGMNNVLYRIENGNGPWAFSLSINLDDQVPAKLP